MPTSHRRSSQHSYPRSYSAGPEPPARRRRRDPTPAGQSALLPWLAEHGVLAGLLAALLVALLAEMPWVPRPARTILLPAAVVLLYTLIAAAGPAESRPLRAYFAGPGAWLAGLLAWAAVCAALSPYRAFAVAEGLRLLLGAGVYFTAAYVLRPHETRFLPYALIGFGAAIGLYGIVQFGQSLDTAASITSSVFGNHEQLGSFLTLLFAPALALALDRGRPTRQLLAAQGCAVVLGAALLLARTRSAWAGAAVALLLLTWLALRYSTVRLTRSSRALVIGPALIVCLGFAGLLVFGQLAPLVSARAATLSHALDDTSFSDRLHRWRSACRMVSERPVTGWGLGAWPVLQGRWTHQGDDAAEVLGGGTGHSNLAHNFWAQWAAETGGAGLLLHVGFLASFFAAGLSALPRLSRDSRTLLIASLVAAAAGAADMVGAPSYTFPGVSSLFWVWLGLGAGVTGEAPEPKPKGVLWAVPLGVGTLAALGVIGIGNALRAAGRDTPRGTLTVTATPPGPVPPGTRVLWTAVYTAPDGTPRPTAPGTVWAVSAGSLTKPSPTYLALGKSPLRSGWQGDVPAGVSEVTVTADYRDSFSRKYEVSQTVPVQQR